MVSTAQAIVSDTYRDVTITATGRATLAGALSVERHLLVQPGGALNPGSIPLLGAGTFTLSDDATLTVSDPEGLVPRVSAGQVLMAGTRTYSPEAHYVFTSYLGLSIPHYTGHGLTGARDLTVATGVELLPSRPISISRTLRLASNATLTTASTEPLTLLSNAAGTAMLINEGSGRVAGPVTVQRWISPAHPGQAYRHISSPMTGTTVSDLTCAGFAAYVNPAYNTLPRPRLPLSLYPNVFGYDERRGPASLDFLDGYYSPNSLSELLFPGRGYAAVLAGGLTTDFVGFPNQATFTTTSLTRTGGSLPGDGKAGWHLLGNPFASPLDWDLVPIPAGLSGAIYVFRYTGPTTGTYLSRVGAVGTLLEGLLPVGQGFFARVTGTGPVSLVLPNSARPAVWVDPTYSRPVASQRALLSLTVAAAAQPATALDELFVTFDSAATVGLDDRFDAPRPGRNVGIPTLATLIGPDEAAINGLPFTPPAAGLTVELLAAAPAPGTYALGVGQLANLDHLTIALLDRLTNTRYPLSGRPTVTFSSTSANAEIRGRFALEINVRPLGLPAPAAALRLTATPNPARETVQFSGTTPGPLTLRDVVGRVVLTATADATGGAALDLRGLPAGVYSARSGGQTTRVVVE